ncbi:MAG: archaeosine biosynthesis radical SAM protein RaSEA [Candidatus Heimdallarchaeota archaeon]|nr:MAG: archaeosine biosynthesis radical SAM protein RaSEA [Candidatus Heimdallarchaeota archaeon]
MPLQKNFLLASKIFEIRQEFLENRPLDFKPKLWSSITETRQDIVIVMVVPTRGCSWAFSESGGCSVCGYINDSSHERPIPEERILKEIDLTLSRVDSVKPIEFKLYNSGSFFDENDVPKNLRIKILEKIQKNPDIYKLSVENRPEFLINQVKIIKEAKKILEPIQLEIGIGIESSNNAILKDCMNKGFSIKEYKKSVQIIRSLNIRLKSYVFVKPPFLTENEAIVDAIKTARDAIDIGTDVISFNPCNIQNGTLVSHLHKQDRYQPPWIWSVLYIVKTIREEFPNIEILCEPTAGGKLRGTHNCGKCDKTVLDLINKITEKEEVNDDPSKLCSCFCKWKVLVETPIETFRSRNLSRLRRLDPLNE